MLKVQYLLLPSQLNEITSHFLDKETRHREINNLPIVTQLVMAPYPETPKVIVS